MADARRFAVLIALVFFASAYAIIPESARRASLPTVLFLDYVLHAMDYVEANAGLAAELPEDELTLYGSAFEGQVVVERSRYIEARIPTVSLAGLFCAEDVYEVTPNERELRVDSYSSPLLGSGENVTPIGNHVLIEFAEYCESRNQYGAEDDYAMVGKFRVSEQPQGTIGVLLDDGDELYFGRRMWIEHHLRMLVSSVTGTPYSQGEYHRAITDFLTHNQTGPDFLGVSISALYAVLALPLVLFLLAVSFFHRVRRIDRHDGSPWLLLRPKGIAEHTCSVLWQLVLVVTSAVVYWAVDWYRRPGSLDLRPPPILHSEPERLLESMFFVLLTMGEQVQDGGGTDEWILYARIMCGLSLVIVLLSLTTLYRIRIRFAKESG